MKPFLLFLILSGACCLAWSQEPFYPKQYSFGRRHVFFEDQFNDDRNGWLDTSRRDEEDPPSKDTIVSRRVIAGGYLDYQVIKGKRPYSCVIPVAIDQQKDFEIELSVKLEALKKYRVAGTLVWGRRNMERCNYLYMSTEGKFLMLSCDTEPGGKCSSKSRRVWDFNPREFKKITLRRYQDRYYLFVNERLEGTFPFRPLKGNKLGLGTGPGGHIICDYIKVSYLD
ncbi:hypothetical protein [Taibaiella koreensis]|uniref:hypothetical protein n=1 Tax=Taibaiella koreensis TaxID=1268548 RepID=UPI000E59DAC1|nr:hypothetical protein [Taibaiella koreensis]